MALFPYLWSSLLSTTYIPFFSPHILTLRFHAKKTWKPRLSTRNWTSRNQNVSQHGPCDQSLSAVTVGYRLTSANWLKTGPTSRLTATSIDFTSTFWRRRRSGQGTTLRLRPSDRLCRDDFNSADVFSDLSRLEHQNHRTTKSTTAWLRV